MAADNRTSIRGWEDIQPGMIIWARLFLPHQKKGLDELLNKCKNCIALIEVKHEQPLNRRHKIISLRRARPVLILEKLATHATVRYVRVIDELETGLNLQRVTY
jgi:hypothetical protein